MYLICTVTFKHIKRVQASSAHLLSRNFDKPLKPNKGALNYTCTLMVNID